MMAACQPSADAPTDVLPIPDDNPPAEAIVPSARCATELGRFGGLQWQARTQGLSGPGPNVWNACNAWFETDGLHLRIDRIGGVWTSAEVFTTGVVGYGRIEMELSSPVHAPDPNVVLGLFTYPGGGLDGLHEIDIELAHFGVTAANATNLNYVVYSGSGPKGTLGRCALRWDSPVTASVHRFLWSAAAVSFQSFDVTAIASNIVPYRAWTFVPSGAFTISSGRWPLHLNLWLYGGKAPANAQPVEIVIRRVTYSTTTTATTTPSTTCR
ncbi:MAG: hypothetical protein C0497_05645 [Gemmatimonas sp.]|nr:hypothetical protein [Gemmatimonas sp.]